MKSSSVAVVSWDLFSNMPHRVAFLYSLHDLIFRKKSVRRTASHQAPLLWLALNGVFFWMKFFKLYNSSHLHNLMVFHQANKNNKQTRTAAQIFLLHLLRLLHFHSATETLSRVCCFQSCYTTWDIHLIPCPSSPSNCMETAQESLIEFPFMAIGWIRT